MVIHTHQPIKSRGRILGYLQKKEYTYQNNAIYEGNTRFFICDHEKLQHMRYNLLVFSRPNLALGTTSELATVSDHFRFRKTLARALIVSLRAHQDY